MNRPNQDMQQKRMNQKELYEWIMMLGFCAVDMMLYLDTHPDDEEALKLILISALRFTMQQNSLIRNSLVN